MTNESQSSNLLLLCNHIKPLVENDPELLTALIQQLQQWQTEQRKQKRGDLLAGMQFFASQAIAQGEDKTEETLTRLESGLGVNIPRVPKFQQLARWIIKQEADGHTLDTWLKWLKADEWRAGHLYQFADAEKIRMTYPQAFTEEGKKAIASYLNSKPGSAPIVKNSDGSLYV